jgi:hypothetical protein
MRKRMNKAQKIILLPKDETEANIWKYLCKYLITQLVKHLLSVRHY